MLSTSDGADIKYRMFTGTKKSVVNIELIVMKVSIWYLDTSMHVISIFLNIVLLLCSLLPHW